LAWLARRRGGSSGSVCGAPFFPRVLVHLVGLDVFVRQRLAVGGGQHAALDLMPQAEHVLAADADLAGELGRGHPLGDAAEDQEDLGGAEVGPLPGGAGEHVEDPTAGLAAVIDDGGIGMVAMDVEALASTTAGAGEPLGVEQVEELPAAALLVHQGDDREVHEVGSEKVETIKPWDQQTRTAHAGKGPTTYSVT
jgi:hypothetical protein